MTELIIQIPQQKEALVKALIEELGGSVVQKETSPVKKNKAASKKKKEEIDHTYLFGKWKDYDIDPRKIREALWTRD